MTNASIAFCGDGFCSDVFVRATGHSLGVDSAYNQKALTDNMTNACLAVNMHAVFALRISLRRHLSQ